jgi:hypothetical protein
LDIREEVIGKVVTKREDLDIPKEIVSKVIGETCWKASLSYGDELRLHIGARMPYSHPALRGQEKGAWMLGTQGSAWNLSSSSKTLASSEDTLARINQELYDIEGSTIVAFEIDYPDLLPKIEVSNDRILTLILDSDDDFEIPYWELFTPYRKVLKVGPGTFWSYIRTDLPEIRGKRS